jgi:regulator of protease activity HflC (stomatin/prohibitin superfamily)
MNMMEQVLDVPTQEVITRDNATGHGRRRRLLPGARRRRAAYEVTNLENAILNSP